MKWKGFLIFAVAFLAMVACAMSLVFCGSHALAQTVDGGNPDAGVVTDTSPVPADGEITDTGMIVKEGQKVVETWKTFGWIAGMAAAVSFLLLLLRFKRLDLFLEARKWKWIKPYLAVPLGGLLGFFSSMASGKGWAESIVAGVIAGVMSPGLHSILTKGNTR